MSTIQPPCQMHGARMTSPAHASALRLKAMSVALMLALGTHRAMAAAAGGASADVQFDPAFLAGGAGSHLDIARFDRGDVVFPGVHHVTISVEHGWQGEADIMFRASPNGGNAIPCYTKGLLTHMGVDWSALAQAKTADGLAVDTAKRLGAGMVCDDIGALVPGATATYDSSRQHLHVTIPQAYVRHEDLNWADPSQWSNGITAGMASYSFDSFTSRGRGGNSTNAFLGLNTGINLDGWRLRQQGNVAWSTGQHVKYQSANAYIQHDVTALRSQLTLGDTYTPGDMFDSVQFRGVSLASDDRMLPDSQMGFAPVIRGTAASNALVTVRQNGQIIYQKNVPPGPFAINDLGATGSSGNLTVTVTEADGTTRTRVVPFAVTPESLRPGITRYRIGAGQVIGMPFRHAPKLIQATWQHGFSNMLTGYGGVTAATGYDAALVGTALNTRAGAVTFDITHARTSLSGLNMQGSSFRLGYSKTLEPSNTYVSLAAYRYSTGGYLGLNDAMTMRSAWQEGNFAGIARQRSSLSLDINQPLGGNWGSIYVSGSDTQYWNASRNITYSLGYSNSYKSISYSISAQRTYDIPGADNAFANAFQSSNGPSQTWQGRGRADNQVMVQITVPLGGDRHPMSLSTQFTNDSQYGKTLQAALYGSLGSNNQFNYGVSASPSLSQGASNYSLNASYEGSDGTVGATWGQSSGSSTLGLHATGGLVVHSGGVTFTQQLTGDSIALIHAPHAKGASVNEMGGTVKVDSHGYAVVPYVRPYRIDTFTLNPSGLPFGVELKDTMEYAVPRAGAVVLLNYRTDHGRPVLMDVIRDNGKPLPFTADVIDAQGKSVAAVGQDSQIVANDLPDQGRLTVIWGNKDDQRCSIDYTLPKANGKPGYVRMHATCIGGGMMVDKGTPSRSSNQASVIPQAQPRDNNAKEGRVSQRDDQAPN